MRTGSVSTRPAPAIASRWVACFSLRKSLFNALGDVIQIRNANVLAFHHTLVTRREDIENPVEFHYALPDASRAAKDGMAVTNLVFRNCLG